MKSLVRPELPTASACSSQATSAAVDNSAPVQTRPFSLIYRGLAVQTNRATSNFYGKRLTELLGELRYGFVMSLNGPDAEYERQKRKRNQDYRSKLLANRQAARALLVELLRYQRWANEV